MLPEVGITGLIVILIVALLVFGPKRLPEIGRSLGKGIREFKGSLAGLDEPAEPALVRDSAVESAGAALNAPVRDGQALRRLNG